LGVAGIIPNPQIGVQNPVGIIQGIVVGLGGNQSEINALAAIINQLGPALGSPNGAQLANALLCGAHVVFTNQTLSGLLAAVNNQAANGLAQRTSSHYRGPVVGLPPLANNPHQYGINIRIGQPLRQAHLLFGSTSVPHNPNGPLFIQLENAGVGGGLLQHMFDFVSYAVTGNQVGPFGRCGYNDGNPIQIL
jgi:hypothetical protein